MSEYVKDAWMPGEQAWFEYHCFESDQSSDAALWHRSHALVTVVRHLSADEHTCVADVAPTLVERGAEYAMPCMYYILFEDGAQFSVFEDELLTSPDGYFRPDPPMVLTTA